MKIINTDLDQNDMIYTNRALSSTKLVSIDPKNDILKESPS